jgi:WXG100 family type VII secretion target
MALIQVTPETLRSKSGEVRSLKTEHDTSITKLTTLVHALNEQWKGTAQDAFVTKFDSMKAQFTNFSEMLEGYAKLMDESAKNIETADTQSQTTINSFG